MKISIKNIHSKKIDIDGYIGKIEDRVSTLDEKEGQGFHGDKHFKNLKLISKISYQKELTNKTTTKTTTARNIELDP